MALAPIVSITITRATRSLSYAGFGTAMVLGCHKHFRDRIRYYATTTGMTDDGFLTTDPEYIWATGYFSQKPHPQQLAIGRMQADTVDVTIDTAADSTDYTLTIDDIEYKFTSDATGTVAEVVTGLIALLDAAPSLAITGVNQGTKTFTVALDYSENFAVGDKFTIEGSTGNDGVYTVVSVTLNATATDIVTSEAIPNAVVDGVIWAINAVLSATIATKRFTFAGDLTSTFTTDFVFEIFGSTGNDGNYTVTASEYNSTTDITTVTVSETIASAVADGVMRSRVTASSGGAGIISLAADVALNPYTVKVDSRSSMEVLNVSDLDESVTDSLTAITAVDNGWYGLGITFRDSASQVLVATWAESNKKLGGVASEDPNIINQTDAADATSIAAQLKSNARNNTWVFYHPDAADLNNLVDEAPDAAWFGLMFGFQPGQATWANQSLSGVDSYTLTTTQLNNVSDKNCNFLEPVSGAFFTREGKVASGEFIDVIRGIAWLESTMTTDVQGVLVSAPKIPYIDKGIGIIESAVRKRLQIAANEPFNLIVGGVDADGNENIQITVGTAAEQSTANKAARIYPGITWTAILQGAIHEVTITGTVTV